MKLGFIGAGNMARAILTGVLKQAVLEKENILVSDTDKEKLNQLKSSLGIGIAASNQELVSCCDAILIAVKPNVCAAVLDEIRPVSHGKAFFSIVTGWNRKRLEEGLSTQARILRIMPNTPSMVGEGMSVFDGDMTLLSEEKEFAQSIFSAIGRVATVPTHLMDAVVGVSGSGPAYVYMFIEAMADAGVKAGLPRTLAYELAAQTVVGAGQMVLQTGAHPGALKDAVCSPAGTTICAVHVLEQTGFRSAVMDAVDACVEKASALSRN